VTGELAGGRDPGAVAQIGHGGAGGQQARQLGDPSGIPADMLRQRVGRLAVITAVGQRDLVVATADEVPLGRPRRRVIGLHATIDLELAGLPATTRDARIRTAITRLLHIAKAGGCKAIAIENLDFHDARHLGREHTGRRPARGAAGRRHRRLVAGIPTARFRDRLTQMAANSHIAVVAVDPAYTSIWGGEHWLTALTKASPEASGHHAAAVVIGRRALGQRARRREGCDSTRPEDRDERATNSAVRPTPASAGLAQPRARKPGPRTAHGQPRQRRKTPTANRAPPGDQVTEHRSPPPTGQGSLLLSD
jgi:hypothetical protein